MWKSGNSDRFYFLGLQNHCRNEKMLAPWKKSSDQPRQHIKKWIHHLTDKDPYSQNYGFYSSHVGIWELDHKEGWAPKNLCFPTVVLEKTLETWDRWTTRRSNQSILKEISPEYSLEGEAPILWLSDAKSQLIGKDPDAEKDWGQEEKESTEDEMVGWHHRLNRHEFEQTRGHSEGQESLACYSPWGLKESHGTYRLNNKRTFLHLQGLVLFSKRMATIRLINYPLTPSSNLFYPWEMFCLEKKNSKSKC